MNHCRLYIVEGLPCSGKSSTAKYIAKLTGSSFFDEDCGNHPADWEFTAFIPNGAEEFDAAERVLLNKLGEPLPGGIAVPLGKLCGKYDELFQRALRYKIYDCLDWENERAVILHKWRSFVQHALSDDKNSAYVFNCVLMQNPMCETMMRFNFDSSVSHGFIREICDIIAPLETTVIYLRNTDIRSSIQHAVGERGNEWLTAVTDYHCNGGYGKTNALSGFDGYICALEERQRRELEYLPQLPVKSLILTDPLLDWDAAYEHIRREVTGDAR